jgi:hypothetical protein
MLRRYLIERLDMRYRVLGIVGKHFDTKTNLLLRQISAGEYIKLLHSGRKIINIDESIIRSTD